MLSIMHDKFALVCHAEIAEFTKIRLRSCVYPKVRGEVPFLSCAIIAFLASKQFLACMCAEVYVQVAFVRRAVVAMVARVTRCWTLPGVLSTVHDEAATIRCAVFALRTIVRLLTRVRSKVSIEVAFARSTVFTMRAREWLLPRVHSKMLVEDVFVCRSELAVSVSACVRLHAGMHSTVNFEVTTVRCTIIALIAAVRLFFGVYPKMPDEVAVVSRTITAFLALERLETRVRSQVSLQVVFP